MIKINNSIDCCGCSACVQICPKSCISFNEDCEGFRYPLVDQSKCIDCNLCEKVCPILHSVDSRGNIKEILAAINEDDNIRVESSSGGFFTALAEMIIEQDGVIFGARFDENWEVRHDFAETKGKLYLFRGSKYMQSRIGSAYADALRFLKQGRKVLFSGTPCQIAGLKRYLRKDYDNLYTIDFICHGVPSAKIWRMYLAELVKLGMIKNNVNDVKKIGFREKLPSWYFSKILIKSHDFDYISDKENNPYYVAFNMNVTLRPICYECPFKKGYGGSDITMGDFWQIDKTDPNMYDDRGTSMIILHNDRIALPDSVKYQREDFSLIRRYNNAYNVSSIYNGNRKVFFGLFDKQKSVIALLERCTRPTFVQKVLNKIYRDFHK